MTRLHPCPALLGPTRPMAGISPKWSWNDRSRRGIGTSYHHDPSIALHGDGLLRSGLLLQRMGWILYSKFGTVMTS